MADKLSHEAFTKYLNTNFRISLGDSNTLSAELINVSDLQFSPRQERFAIVFRGPRDPLLSQAIYPFEHDEMGEFSLFVVPIQQDDAGSLYEAVFNRISRD